MERIGDHIDEEMTLVQPRLLLAGYELRVGDSVAGTLQLHGLFGSLATAQTEDGGWTFRRSGFLRKSVSVSPRGSDAEIAVFRETGWSHGGVLRMQDGWTLRVKANFWLTSFDICAEGGSVLVTYRRIWSPFRRSASVRILPDAAGLNNLPLLVMLGCSIVVMAIRERASRSG
jgi:hypothetical protein